MQHIIFNKQHNYCKLFIIVTMSGEMLNIAKSLRMNGE